MQRILLLGGGLQGLSFGESLYKQGRYELSVISDEYEIKKSRFFKKVYSVNSSGYWKCLKDILSKEQYDVIVPMGNISVKTLSMHKDTIEHDYHVKCAIVNYDILSVVADKSRFMEFCRENGVPHPHTATVTEETLDSAAMEIGFPSLIKPDFSMGARGVTRVDSMEELRSQFPLIRVQYGSCALQEYIDNPDYYYNVMMYRDSQGKCDNSVVIKIVRMYPVNAGSSCCCISIKNPELVSICRNVLEKLKWVGMADFDVLQRKDTLEYKIIEINPRVPASLRAAYISGVNFPEMIVRDAIGEELQKYQYKSGQVLRYIGVDLLWFLKSPKRLKSSPSWFHFIGGNVFYQDIILSDFSTWYSWLVVGLKKFINQ